MRLLVVSNRLPIVTVEEGGQLVFRESAGGLVSGISAYLDSLRGSSFARPEYEWIGWPGVTIEDPGKRSIVAESLSKFNAHPVFLSESDMDKFYHGFCNKTIWPLFHYFPSYAVYEGDLFAHYRSVNQTFCDVVSRFLRPDDLVWIHDYHLMLLPKLLRERAPQARIGFFLHIPFPSFEMFRLLPMAWRTEILEGLLGADLIGFHAYDYSEYFLRCVLRILGHEHQMGRILLPDHLAKVDTFPMGIDFGKFQTAAANPGRCSTDEVSWEALKGFKVILSVDRLDYTKGILKRLQGYELFLEKNPHWHKKTVLMLVVVPSRVGVDQYQQIKKQIDEYVGKINGKFSTVGWTPVQYQYRFLPFEPLVSLYAASHVALITPLRDGMNLVAKEYLASRTDKTGVLVLSEMTGASKELAEAVIINPNNAEEIAAGIKTAMEMPEPEQIRRNEIMQKRLHRYDVVRWAEDFLNQLPTIKVEQERLHSRLLNAAARQRLIDQFLRASHRTIFLDYDGTLAPFADTPEDARPGLDLLALLRDLCQANNDVVLISGRDKDTMHDWFADIDVALVAEHGAWIKTKDRDWLLTRPLDNSWKSAILPILQTYADRLPGAFVEEKQSSVVWHYRRADPEPASACVKDLVDALVNFTANIDVQVLQGSKVVEIRSGGINKGSAAMMLLSADRPDNFVLAIGDDWTDEDLFRVLPDSACSIKVGNQHSYAKFNLHNSVEVTELLREISQRQQQECGL